MDIVFDFDEVWNRKSQELTKELSYGPNSLVTKSNLLSCYKTDGKFHESIKLKTLYQILKLTIYLQNSIKNQKVSEKINNGLMKIKQSGMKFLENEPEDIDPFYLKEDKLSKQGLEVLKFIVDLT
jgi:hypothetical protein